MHAPRDALATVNQLLVVYCLLSGQLNTIPAKEAKTNNSDPDLTALQTHSYFNLLQKLVIFTLNPYIGVREQNVCWARSGSKLFAKSFQQATLAGKGFNQQMTFHIIVWQHF